MADENNRVASLDQDLQELTRLRNHARRLRDLEAKVKELHETLDSHGIYHA